MGRKFNLELPKYRLAMHFRLVKRRKPLIDKSLLPTVKAVNKKYRSGTVLGKFVRYVSDHKGVRKLFAANFAAVVIATSFLPATRSNVLAASDETIIQVQTPLSTEKGIQLPLGHLKINQGFSFFHPGLDLGAQIGDPIMAIKAGEIIEAGYTRDGYGNTIVIDHGKGLTSRYAHLSKIEVRVGEEVTTNTEIGKVGITGHTSGPHLHLEVRQNGFALNPLSIIPL